MRLSWGLILGVVTGTQAGGLAARQNAGTTSAPPITTSTSGSSDNTNPTQSPTPTTESDSVVLLTRTVTLPNSGSTVTSTTTVSISTVVTVNVTTTDIATTTVTSRDNETATKTVYVTSTEIINAKRSVEEDVYYMGDGPAPNEAQSTPGLAANEPQRVPNRRALITNFVTVTVGSGGGDSTVLVTATRVVRSTTTSVVHTTSFVTETVQLNAKTTITTTSTILLKVTRVSTGAVETSTSEPTATSGSGNDNNNNNNNNNNNDDNSLSTGAKAGIGAGIGVAALIALGAIAFCLFRRRRSSKLDPDDLLGPSSEVPVGSTGAATGGSRGSRPMSERFSSAPGASPRRNPTLPNLQPEGYRGTAMGDGRAGYAKPDTRGASHGPTRSTTTNTKSSALSHGDQTPRNTTPDANSALVSPTTGGTHTSELGNDGAGAKWHQVEAAEMPTDNPASAKWHSDNAHEIDSHAVSSQRSGPVYEMPTEVYR